MTATRHNPAWITERAGILQRICKGAEQRLKRRRGLRRAVSMAAWRWKNRCYRSRPDLRVRLSRKTIIEQFYRWKNNGRTAEAFQLHYQSRRRQIPARLVKEFVRLCAERGVYSMAAAYRKLSELWRAGEIRRPHVHRHSVDLPFTCSTFRRALSKEHRAAIITFQKTERAAMRARERLKHLSEPD